MKLSEAIRLGSTILTPQAGGQHFPETQSGCALGMAAIARGCTFRRVRGPIIATERRTLGVEGVWGDWILSPVSRPCRCLWFRVPRKMRIKEIIAHLFDHHVMHKKNWTLEKLVAWVETVEPKSTALEEPVPPRYISVESQQALDRIRQIEHYFNNRHSSIYEEEDPTLWQARAASFLASHPKPKRTIADGAAAILAGENKNTYQPWIPQRGMPDETGGATGTPALLRR
jgi:hypothetical protein